ncbi:CDP-glycerol glycerophosphotransferase family protein [Butyrivibrio sp. WCE2006]|uniref:CDP-glycerol glycerophosphotransferase family protein n=1 Tax=Butyrivibrio sp. WCE2006 TaxID=1410611 RepID=UPI0005D1CDFE|nr:CDP-glycerol glycerophosphotransferase family protein [Butyrivibrio sp. WCE2006]
MNAMSYDELDHKDCYIYGAGNYAKRLYFYLCILGKQNSVNGFVVTDKSKCEKYLYEKRIYQVSEINKFLRNKIVYLAISPNKSQEIYETLKRMDILEVKQITQEDYLLLSRLIEEGLRELPIKRNRVFFDCYQGEGYSCNCKYLAKFILDAKLPVELIWNLKKGILNNLPSGITCVERFSPEYYVKLYTSGIIISNDRAEEELEKRDQQYLIDTWHGTGPFKKVFASIDYASESSKIWDRKNFNRVDLFVSNSADNTCMFRESFLYEGEIEEFGVPRNDVLFQKNDNYINEIKERLGIDQEYLVILYAPTFRENSKDNENEILDVARIISVVSDRFKKKVMMLYRFHYWVKYEGISQKIIDNSSKCCDVTDYADVMELLIISDILITDYSSIMWDFSLQKRPVFLFQPDLDDYLNSERGFYWPVQEWPYPRAKTNKELCKIIQDFDNDKYQRDLHLFFEKDPSFDDGHACERLSYRIMDVINNPQKYNKL